MSTQRYQALGPLLAGEGSRAFLGLELAQDGKAQPVVLVWVPEHAVRDPALFALTRQETEQAAQLDHPNIIGVRGLATLEEGVARVVEFVDGESLRRILDIAGPLPPPLAARIICDAATGVHYAHVAGREDGQPLVHGDLRPETLIISFTGISKVSGYGALPVAPKEHGGQRVLGRRVHAAPEQVIGGREAAIRQTDVYLLGIALYECLTGIVPFRGEPDFDRAVLSKPLPTLEAPEAPSALKEVIARATAKKAADRYETALELREAIERAFGSLPSSGELAAFLERFFPSSDDARVARRRVIENGIAELARRQWERPAPSPRPAPARASEEPERPVTAPVRTSDGPTGPSRAPRFAAAVLILAGLGAVLALTARAPGANPPAVEVPPVAAQTRAEPESTDAATEAQPAQALGADAASHHDGGEVAASADAESPVELAALVPPALPRLELVVEPEVDLEIDGKPAGRSPFRGELAPGRHVVKLTDRALGISMIRSVTVKPKGTTEEFISVPKGYVSVSAPDGAVVFIDGRRLGTAPLKTDISVYEGRHRIVVTVGKARWQQPFSVRADERMYFNVELE